MLKSQPQGDGNGRWTFGRCLGHEHGAPMNGTSVLEKALLSPCEDTRRR